MEPSELDRLIRGLDFSFSNLAASTNHTPVRSAFRKLALERGMSEIDFERWAQTKKWEK